MTPNTTEVSFIAKLEILTSRSELRSWNVKHSFQAGHKIISVCMAIRSILCVPSLAFFHHFSITHPLKIEIIILKRDLLDFRIAHIWCAFRLASCVDSTLTVFPRRLFPRGFCYSLLWMSFGFILFSSYAPSKPERQVADKKHGDQPRALRPQTWSPNSSHGLQSRVCCRRPHGYLREAYPLNWSFHPCRTSFGCALPS